MGDCTILHGSSTELHTQVPDGIRLICTDPPFGVAYQSNRATTEDGQRWAKAVANDGDIDTAIDTFYGAVEPLLPKMLDDAEMYVFTTWSVLDAWMLTVGNLDGFKVKHVLVWDKMHHGPGDLEGDYAPAWEAIIYAKKGRWLHPKRHPDVLHVPRPSATDRFHPTEKPVALLEILIAQSTAGGDLVVDPFAGSGSAIKAAQNLGRRGVGIEIDAEHHKRASERLNEMLLPI